MNMIKKYEALRKQGDESAAFKVYESSKCVQLEVDRDCIEQEAYVVWTEDEAKKEIRERFNL